MLCPYKSALEPHFLAKLKIKRCGKMIYFIVNHYLAFKVHTRLIWND